MRHALRVAACTVAPTPWRNGGGTTRELLAWPPAPAPWQVRVSVASVERDGPFSSYPGVERWFAVIGGAGVLLHIGRHLHSMDPATAPLQFDGAEPVQCSLKAGPTRDLNLMTTAGSGAMVPALAGQPWQCRLPQRGLYTRTAGVFQAHGAPALDLAADTFLWQFDADAAAWHFAPLARFPPAMPEPPGYWLGYTPGVDLTRT
jgi:hypothetical protein